MHSSWPFFGATSGLRQQQQSTDAAPDDRNANASFEFNSYVRSLNRHRAQLPVGFQFRGLTCNGSKNEWADPNTGKSLNELLSLLNDSVDRVVGCNPEDRADTPNFASFRAGVEEKDPALLNDLINLVSSTAHQLRDINTGNAKSEISARNVDLRSATRATNPSDIALRTLLHPDIRARKECSTSGLPTAESAFPSWEENSRTESATESASVPSKANRGNRRGFDLDPTPTSDLFLARPPELVEIYSENHTARVERAELSEESLETLRQLESPRCFPGEVLRLAKVAGFAGASPINGDRSRHDWPPTTRRINFDDELWPVGPCIASGRDYPPFFTGTASRAFRCRATERNFGNDDGSTNASRSSPIFAGAGEATVEPPEIVVPTRDGGDCSRESRFRQTESGCGGDRMTPVSIVDGIGIPDLESFYDASPTKLDKIDPMVTEKKNCTVEEAKKQPQPLGSMVPLVLEEKVEEEEASTNACKREDQARKPRACVKFPTKRVRRVCKQLKKSGRRKMASSPKTDDEDTSARDTSSASQSPITSGRRSPVQRFSGVSPTMGDDVERMGSVKGEDDSIETQMGMSSEMVRPRNCVGESPARRLRAVAKPSEMAIPEKTKLRVPCNVVVEDHEPPRMEERPKREDACSFKRPSLGTNQKSRVSNSVQPIWKPGGSVRIVPSSSSCSMSRRPKIAQVSTPGWDPRGEKPKEHSDSINGSKDPAVRKNQSQALFAERCRGPGRNNEAKMKTPRSRSKQRPGTPKKVSKTGIPEHARSEVKSLGRELVRNNSSLNDKANGLGSTCKTAIPVLRSKTFVYQMRLEAPLRRVASKEDCTKNPKSVSLRSSRNSVKCGPLKNRAASREEAEDTTFESRIDTDTEQSHSDVRFSSNSNSANLAPPAELSSIAPTSKVPQASLKTAVLSGATEDNSSKDKDLREEETYEQSPRSKFPNRHARSLRMLKDLLSNQGISVDGVTKEAREMRSKISNETAKKSEFSNAAALKKSPGTSGLGKASRGSPGASKSLFEKLAILTEALPDRRDGAIRDSCERSISSFTDLESDSVTSCPRSMRDAGEQCAIGNESSVVSETSVVSERSRHSLTAEEEERKEVSNVCSQMDEEYRRTIYVNAAVSPAPCAAESSVRSCDVAETQTLPNVVDKDSATEEIIQPASRCTNNAFTETERKSSASKEANTEFTGLEISDAASQFNRSEYSTEVASGRDFVDTDCRSVNVNTDRLDIFLKSRGVCVRGPRKIDETSQYDTAGNSEETASGRDYVDSNGVSEYVNTDRQDYLFEDRSVGVLVAQTAEEACQIDPPSNIVDASVGGSSLDIREIKTSTMNEEALITEIPRDYHRLETVIVKDVDVVQWQSSTTLETSRVNCSTCSSNSSIMAWRPVAKCTRRSSAEKFRGLSDRVPKEAITALEIASERAQNLYKAIGIYRENLASRNAMESIVQYCESDEKNSSQISKQICRRCVAPSAEPCNFSEKSKIKTLLEANLKKSFGLRREPSDLPVELLEEDTDCSKLHEEITSLMDDLLSDVVRDVESEAEQKNFLLEERSLQPTKLRNPCPKVTDAFDEKSMHFGDGMTSEFSLLSRNSLLTFIYGTVCSLVFWALQFSITCDSL